MIHNFIIRFVKPCCKMSFSHCHTYRIRESLTQRTRCRFYSRGMAKLRVAGCFAVPLPEIFQVVYAQTIAGKIKETVHKHGSVSGGKHKPVPVEPVGITRIVFPYTCPKDISRGGHAHWGSWMARVSFLYGIHGECSNSIDAHFIDSLRTFRQAITHLIFLLSSLFLCDGINPAISYLNR